MLQAPRSSATQACSHSTGSRRSILGSLAAAFILAGTLGTNASIFVLGAADAAVALVLLLSGIRSLASARFRLSLAAGVLIVAPPLLAISGSPLVLTATEHHLAATGRPSTTPKTDSPRWMQSGAFHRSGVCMPAARD
jgi:hypothetical protein